MKLSVKSFLAICFCLTSAASQADIIPTLSDITASGSNFQWNYSTNVTVNQLIRPGDYFTIYDFGSIMPGSNSQPAGWTFSSALVGLTPSTVLPNDNPNLLNLTWTYTGTTPIPGQALLGIFSAISETNQMTTANFAARATAADGPLAGTKIDNIGMTAVPVPEVSALVPVIFVCAAGIATSLIRRRRATV